MHLIKQTTRFLILLLNSVYFIACADTTPAKDTTKAPGTGSVITINAPVIDTFPAGKIIKNISCKTDATQSYSIYIPVRNQDKTLPVIYMFDPHGNGTLPLDKYYSLADKYGFILVGSSNSKNGNDWPTTESIWIALSKDTRSRLKIDQNRMYTCGFSGGAKVAAYLALQHHEVKAVIANGAAPEGDIGAAADRLNFTAIAGEGDMNMTDLVAFNNELNKSSLRHHIIFFDGIHEWAPVNTMSVAIAGLQLDAMYQKLISTDNRLISEYTKESKSRLDKYLAGNKLLKAEKECSLSVSMLHGISDDVKWFKEKDLSISRNPAYKKQWQIQQQLFNTEQNVKAVYNQQFQQGDNNYWSNTIKDLKLKAVGQSPEAAMYQRLLAYLSLAFYSISSRFIAANQNGEAIHFVELYKLADPVNSEAWYFSAVLNARSNNTKEAENDLLKAVDHGFTDVTRMTQQPDFLKLSQPINFSIIGEHIRNKK